LRHFNIFRIVCEQKSITSAAEELNMTQPAVSIAVKELESFYQIHLFERMNRRLYLTDAGQNLLQYAETILCQYDESIENLRNKKIFSKCCLGLNSTIGEIRLSKVMKQIKTELPLTDLHIHVNHSQIIEEMLSTNEIDFAVIDQVPEGKNWIMYPCGGERMMAVCSAEANPQKPAVWTMTLQQLSEEKLLLREKGSGCRETVDQVLKSRQLSVVPLIESTSSQILLKQAEEGMGIAVLPEYYVKEDLKSGKLKEINISDAVFERNDILIHHHNKYITPAMRTIMDFFRDSALEDSKAE